MKCPACSNELQQITVAGIDVDVCKGGCGGIWFDRFELGKFDEAADSAGEALLDVEKNPDVQVDLSAQRTCPKCEMDVVMMQHYRSVKGETVIDECPTCGGYWLDSGELRQIRTSIGSDEERKELTDTHFTETFGAGLQKMRDESDAKKTKARSMAGLLRWVCPSNYVKGKQEWGAF